MDTKRHIIIILIACIMLSGCVGQADRTISATYLSEDGNTLYLFTNGVFVFTEPAAEGVVYGEYAVADDTLYIMYACLGTYKSLVFTEDGTGYVDEDGVHWDIQR